MKKILFSILFIFILTFNTFAQGFSIYENRNYNPIGTDVIELYKNDTNNLFGYIKFNCGNTPNISFKTLIREYDPTMLYTLILYENGQLKTYRYQFTEGEQKEFKWTAQPNSEITITFQAQSTDGAYKGKIHSIYLIDPQLK